MSTKINDEVQEAQYYKRIEWLEEKGLEDKDVMSDENGREYVIRMDEDDEQRPTTRREYLPVELTLDGITNFVGVPEPDEF